MRSLSILLALLLVGAAAADPVKTANGYLEAIHEGDHAALGVTAKELASLREQLGKTRRIDELRGGGKGPLVGRLHRVKAGYLVVRLLRREKSLRFGGFKALSIADYYQLKLVSKPKYPDEKPKPGPDGKKGKRPRWGDRKKIKVLDRDDPVNTGYHVLRAIDRNDTLAMKRLWTRAAARRFDFHPVVARAKIVRWLRDLKSKTAPARFVVEVRESAPLYPGGVLARVRTVRGQEVLLYLVREKGQYCFDDVKLLKTGRYRQTKHLWREVKR